MSGAQTSAASALRAFVGDAEIASIVPAAGGHIHDSYVVEAVGGGGWFLQRVNTRVFPEPDKMMENIVRVTSHIRGYLSAAGPTQSTRQVLTPVPTKNGDLLHQDTSGTCRVFNLIRDVRVHLTATTPLQAEQAGRAFGAFHRMLADFPPPRLHETIVDFHHAPKRFEMFEEAVAGDPNGRVANVRDEISFARSQRPMANVLNDLHSRGTIAERVVHNDAKIANVLFDATTDEPICIVDLDTVMPGLTLHDFGDMVRSTCCLAQEDESDQSGVALSPELFEGLVRGYMAEAASMLTDVEIAHLVTAGEIITLEQGVRFLTDYLQGDTYYRISRPMQNLDRARTQFALLQSIQRQKAALERLILACLPRRT